MSFPKLVVGLSGGLDSTVLLHLLVSQPTLRSRLLAVHVNHDLSPNASMWQAHCQHLCLSLHVDFVAHTIAFDKKSNIEEAARIARYALFSSLLQNNYCLILGHHLDDQAETLLLNLFRGAGIAGLAAMTPLSQVGNAKLARPLLSCSRQELEAYALAHHLNFIHDESNLDSRYSRNFLRQELIPLLKSRWPTVVSNIAKTANHCQEAQQNLEDLACIDSNELLASKSYLLIEPLKNLSPSRLKNILKIWLKKNHIQMPSSQINQLLIQELIFAAQDSMPKITWGTVQIRRYQQILYIDTAEDLKPQALDWTNFPHALSLSDTRRLIAKKSEQGLKLPKQAIVNVRFRKGGEELVWHGQTKQLKKLFQEWSIPPWQRDKIPLIYVNDQLAAVVGYVVSDLFFSRDLTLAYELSLE